MSTQQKTGMYGLPLHVVFCKKCVMSNQRPTSIPEFTHQKNQTKQTLLIDKDGVCDACRFAEKKEHHIDWNAREQELLKLLERYRSHDGQYDVLVPGSGGKDSVKVAHMLKYKYDMHPLTVTWPPHMYTEIGLKNFHKWLDIGGFDNITYTPNGRIHRLLTRLATKNLFHPFQPFIIGQKNVAPKIALKFGIKLIFYGENEAEYGNPISDNAQATRDPSYFGLEKKSLRHIFLGGVSAETLLKNHPLTLHDLEAYLPPSFDELIAARIDVRYLGYYMKWTPQESYYYSVEHIDFEANPERTEGTFSKYNSLDDKMDGLHYWTTYIKFGLGRTSYEASQEIRNKHLTREEAIALVRRFDGEFPKKYFKDILDYLSISEDEFFQLTDRFRPPHLWERKQRDWILLPRIEG